MSSKADDLREGARLRSLRIIAARPQITQRELAGELGISLGAAHYMLRALTETGLLKLARFSQSKNKQGYAYVLMPQGWTEKARVAARFLDRKRAEYEALRAEIEDLSAELGQGKGAAPGDQGCGSLSSTEPGWSMRIGQGWWRRRGWVGFEKGRIGCPRICVIKHLVGSIKKGRAPNACKAQLRVLSGY